MKRGSIVITYLFLILILFTNNVGGQIPDFNNIKWSKKKIAPGLTWKSSHTGLYDTLPQNINILVISLLKRSIGISYNPEKNEVLSKQAEKAGAIAAVNGGFFNIQDGGSVSYLKTGGKIPDGDTSKTWKRNSNMTGSLLIDNEGHVTIGFSKENKWYDNHQEYTEVLLSGPLLLSEMEKINPPATPLALNRHPRTAIGRTGKHRILLVTLDGRTEQAAGMTISELADMMISLNCRDALNLDGGGSTTMWISGQPFNGIVNMPCDNKKFDHEGERAVSDILIIR